MVNHPILPGTRVRTEAGLLGSVERTESQESHNASPSLLVRAADSAQRYRFPLRLVRTVGEETEQAVAYRVVFLDVSEEDLPRYRLADDLLGQTQAEQVPPVASIPLVAEQNRRRGAAGPTGHCSSA